MLKLLRHQVEVLNETQKQNKVAYYLDMSLGKTFVGAEKMIRLNEQMNLLICQKSKVEDWIEHFDKYYAGQWITYDLTDKHQFEQFVNIDRRTPVFKFIGIIDYELAWRRPILSTLVDFTLMLDESSLIQNEKSKQAKLIYEKLNPNNVILLSGIPTDGKYENLYSQLSLLGWNISKELYWKQYIETEWVETDDGYLRKKVVGYKNVDRLKRKLREHGAVFLKSEEVFDLPEQTFIPINVPSSKEYKYFIRHKIAKVDDVEFIGDTLLTHMLYSRMLCGSYNQDKVNAFKDLIESTSDRLVVFYNFKFEIEVLSKLCGERPISIVNGDEKNLDNYENYDDSITFVQYRAGATGLNLQKANKIIYFTLPLLSELYEQSKKCIHKIGQEKACFYYLLICQNSLEGKILDTLNLRKDYNDKLFEEEC